jgi:AcrR family transcriptional regulator
VTISELASEKRPLPKQERAQQTYELLLDVAGNLLAEVGIDRISTNMICSRAGLTPPALYRYFKDKYDVLEALGLRLMARQNVVLEHWIARHADEGIDALRGGIEELLRETAAVTQSEPGAVWILRALHASPRLVHVRLESHRYVTDKLVEAYMRYMPSADRDALWQEVRLSVELGFAADEMLQEETRVSADAVFSRVARILQADSAVRPAD